MLMPISRQQPFGMVSSDYIILHKAGQVVTCKGTSHKLSWCLIRKKKLNIWSHVRAMLDPVLLKICGLQIEPNAKLNQSVFKSGKISCKLNVMYH